MEYKVKDRLNNQIIIKESKINIFLYTTKLGRILLKIIVLPFISKIVGIYQNSIFSKNMIPKFIKNNHINMNDYEQKDYKSFNDFFSRKGLYVSIPCIEPTMPDNYMIGNDIILCA